MPQPMTAPESGCSADRLLVLAYGVDRVVERTRNGANCPPAARVRLTISLFVLKAADRRACAAPGFAVCREFTRCVVLVADAGPCLPVKLVFLLVCFCGLGSLMATWRLSVFLGCCSRGARHLPTYWDSSFWTAVCLLGNPSSMQ